MTILCATHFSDSSADAVAVAAQFARQSHQPLWLTSVVPSRSPKEQAVDSALHHEATTLREQGVEVATTILHGQVDRAVARLCTDLGAELLVVGDTSRTGTTFRSSSIDRFASGVPVPLLVVRSRIPFEAWASGARPLKVLLALDHVGSVAHAREWISRMARYGPLDVVGAHVWVPEGEPRPSAAALLESELKAVFQGLPSNVTSRVQLEVGRGRIGPLVLALAAREQADVVVLGTHAHKGLLARRSSVEHDVLGEALMSVALVPEAPIGVSPGSPVAWPEEPVLFTHVARGTLSLGAVAAVIAASLIGTGVLLKVYRDGAFSPLTPGPNCELICRGP